MEIQVKSCRQSLHEDLLEDVLCYIEGAGLKALVG